MYRKNSALWGDSHFQFSLNVFDWLAGNPTRIANVPDEAIITVGPGPSLTPEELESYSIFTGAIHDHTTHSDGANTPREMLDKALRLKFDYFAMSDHSYASPASVTGITGALAIEDMVVANNIDLHMGIAAELSAVKHTLGFPLTSNVFTSDQQEAVDLIHAQGGYAFLCHPTIGFDYAPVYENRTAMGYDGVEINNRGFFFGGGEDGFTEVYYGAADTHSANEDGMENVLFVQNPGGPNGRITDDDIIEAILNNRIVVVDPYNDMLLGKEVWVNRYLELRAQAESELDTAIDLVEGLDDAGEDVGLSLAYLDDATTALEYFNLGRALRMTQNATSDVILGLDLSLAQPEYCDPSTEYQIAMTLKNNNTYSLAIDTTVLHWFGATYTSPHYTIEVAGESTTTADREVVTDEYGLIMYDLNLHSYNTTEFINPILLPMRGIIENVTTVVTEEEEGYEVDLVFWMGRGSGEHIRSATLHYNDGSGESEVAMERGWDQFIYTLGPFDPGTELDLSIVVRTYENLYYTVGEQELTLGIAPTTTTNVTSSTDTTTTSGGQTPYDMSSLLLIVGGVGIGLVVLVVVIVKFRK
jgi:hypothetical protein